MSDEPLQPEPEEMAETDERFPSGPWVGFWLQHGLAGRQWMRDLWLRFSGGRITGGGSDCVGAFTLRGRYELDSGKCTLFKEYVGAHLVTYAGQNDGDGLWLWGVWTISTFDRGGFHLWPKGEADPTGQHLEAEEDVPVGELEESAT